MVDTFSSPFVFYALVILALGLGSALLVVVSHRRGAKYASRKIEFASRTLNTRLDGMVADLRHAQHEIDTLRAENADHRSDLDRAARLVGEQALEIDDLQEKLGSVARQAQELGGAYQADHLRLQSAMRGGLLQEARDMGEDAEPGVPSLVALSPLGHEDHAFLALALARNLSSMAQPPRILFIDCDWRGAATQVLTEPAAATDAQRHGLAARLLSRDLSPQEALELAPAAAGMAEGSRILTSSRDQAEHDNRAVWSWLSGQDAAPFQLAPDDAEEGQASEPAETASAVDPRSQLQHFLAHPVVQAHFDLVVMIAPPVHPTAMSLAWLNCICAASHAVIAARSEPRTALALPELVDALDHGRRVVWPRLDLLGVAPIFPSREAPQKGIVQPALLEASRFWSGSGEKIPLLPSLVLGDGLAGSIDIRQAEDLARRVEQQMLG
ncbi:MAG: hypothetical protein MRY63_02490 [Neomegalonema sp.]|nr:hypothetical protein [Neomegalonema sp.]